MRLKTGVLRLRCFMQTLEPEMGNTSVGSFYQISCSGKIARLVLCDFYLPVYAGGGTAMKKNKTVEQLAVTAVMLAASTLLSLIKIIDLPYGGSVTLASLLPIMIVAYRYGTPWGLLTGLAHGLLQFALGASVLGYVTGWQSVVAVILLDYVIAFSLVGLSGLSRKITKNQPAGFLIGAFFGCFARYVSHVISGATVWAGLSIPDSAALLFSLIYNATYMLPEMLVLMVVGYYVASAIDFRTPRLTAIRDRDTKVSSWVLAIIAGLLLAGAAVFDIAAIFSKLQNGETGEFDFANISAVNWPLVIIVTVIAVVFAVALFILRAVIVKQQKEKDRE